MAFELIFFVGMIINFLLEYRDSEITNQHTMV
jgi:hypothetical protein